MSENIVLKNSPLIEFQMLEKGFQLNDEQTVKNSGFYEYSDLLSVDLNKTWFPKVAKWLRIFTWIMNGVPFFPDEESYKKSSVIFHIGKGKIRFWLTDIAMVDCAKNLKKLLDKKMAQEMN